MRYSNNLNLMIKIIEKVSNIYARDFIELENLQNSPISAIKFANASYLKVKKTIFEEFSKARNDYNINFSDGEKITRPNNSGDILEIFAIDGLENLSRANPDFTIGIALKKDQQTTCLAIKKIIGNELYSCEKGIGSYLNNRRVRIAKRPNSDIKIIASDNPEKIKQKLQGKNTSQRCYGSKLLEIAYMTSGKIDHILYDNFQNIESFLLLIKEAGGTTSLEGNSIFITQ